MCKHVAVSCSICLALLGMGKLKLSTWLQLKYCISSLGVENPPEITVNVKTFRLETFTHLVMLNKVHKRSPLHLHRLAVSVIERQDKVEEVGLAEI